MMDAEQAQASLNEIRERERQGTERAIHGSRPIWRFAPLIPAGAALAVLLDLCDQGVVPSWGRVAATVAGLVLVGVLLVAVHRSVRIEPRHRPGWWFGVASFAAVVVVSLAANQVARVYGSPWLNTVNAVAIIVTVTITNVLWRRLALRAAARHRDPA